jgi:hypothetical protein
VVLVYQKDMTLPKGMTGTAVWDLDFSAPYWAEFIPDDPAKVSIQMHVRPLYVSLEASHMLHPSIQKALKQTGCTR